MEIELHYWLKYSAFSSILLWLFQTLNQLSLILDWARAHIFIFLTLMACGMLFGSIIWELQAHLSFSLLYDCAWCVVPWKFRCLGIIVSLINMDIHSFLCRMVSSFLQSLLLFAVIALFLLFLWKIFIFKVKLAISFGYIVAIPLFSWCDAQLYHS